MAESQSHAAGQSYAVHESMKLHPGLDLGLRHTADSFEDASEFAFEFLDEHDPKREGRVSALEIVRVGPEPELTRDRLALRVQRFAERSPGSQRVLGLRRHYVAWPRPSRIPSSVRST